MDGDREPLRSLFPPGREALASGSGALKGLRRDRSAGNLPRVPLPHSGCGHPPRETAVRARRPVAGGAGEASREVRAMASVPAPGAVRGARTVTETAGAGTGESFRRCPAAAGDHLIGDLGHSAASGIGHGSGHGHSHLADPVSRDVRADGETRTLRNAPRRTVAADPLKCDPNGCQPAGGSVSGNC